MAERSIGWRNAEPNNRKATYKQQTGVICKKIKKYFERIKYCRRYSALLCLWVMIVIFIMIRYVHVFLQVSLRSRSWWCGMVDLATRIYLWMIIKWSNRMEGRGRYSRDQQLELVKGKWGYYNYDASNANNVILGSISWWLG